MHGTVCLPDSQGCLYSLSFLLNSLCGDFYLYTAQYTLLMLVKVLCNVQTIGLTHYYYWISSPQFQHLRVYCCKRVRASGPAGKVVCSASRRLELCAVFLLIVRRSCSLLLPCNSNKICVVESFLLKYNTLLC